MEGSSFVFGDTLVYNVFAFQVIPVLWAGMTMPVKDRGIEMGTMCVFTRPESIYQLDPGEESTLSP